MANWDTSLPVTGDGSSPSSRYVPDTSPTALPGGSLAGAPPAILSRGWTSLSDITNAPPDQPPEGVGRNIAAAAERGGASGFNTILDPVGNIVLPAIARAGGTAWDVAAPLVGLPRMTPQQRADLYGINAPPEQQGPASIAVSQANKALGAPDPYSIVPKTPFEQWAAAGTEGAIGSLPFSRNPLSLWNAGLGAGGTIAGMEAAKRVPDYLAPAVATLTNMATQGTGRALVGEPGTKGVLPEVADTADLGMKKYNIPFNAADVIPGSQYRTPGHVQDTLDAWQGGIVRQMGQNPEPPGQFRPFGQQPGQIGLASEPGTSPALGINRITPEIMTKTRDETSAMYNDVASRTDIGPMQTYRALTGIQGIKNDLQWVPNLSDADKNLVLRNIDIIQNSIDPQTGIMPGSKYLSLTNTNSHLDKLTGASNADLAGVGMKLRDVLNDAFNRSATSDDQAVLNTADGQWRLMKTVQPLVDKAQGGNIDPGDFMNRVRAQSVKFDPKTGTMAYTGGGEAGDLARIGMLIKQGPAPANPVGAAVQQATSPISLLGYLSPAGWAAAGAQGANIGAHALAAPYLRSGFRAQQVLGNALYPPTGPLESLGRGLLSGATGP